MTTAAAGLTASGRQTAVLQRATWDQLEPGVTVRQTMEEQAAAAGMTVDQMLEQESELTGTPIDELRATIEVEPARRILWPWLVVSTDAHSELPGWLVSSAGSSLIVIGLCLAVDERRRGRRVLAVAAPLGRSSLTAYALHVGIIWAVYRAHPTATSAATALLLATAAWMAMVGLALGWTRRFGQAPLERLMRAAGQRLAMVGP